ncbi:acyl-CoA carboxylase epsilon subunit [Kitasatospora sp. NPDC058444]|uniref:acyl-CoA carboxylase epsilon subunit n=1 Tax=Kitasatospora sp. NPDC058444 TaxID=3346504 RepID=UPI00364EDAFF
MSTDHEPIEPLPLIRVLKGHADPGELAALTTLLLARAALTPADPEPAPTAAAWNRPERTPHHRDPRGRRAPRGGR